MNGWEDERVNGWVVSGWKGEKVNGLEGGMDGKLSE